jgi:hypothetical protein
LLGPRLPRFRSPTIEKGCFPTNGIGAVFLRRQWKVDAFLKVLDRDLLNSPRVRVSHYFPGPKGNGKSVWLTLLGLALEERGDVVFHIKHARALMGLQQELELVGNVEKPVYLLVDEVQANLKDQTWGFLLKEDNRGIIVIGAGIPVEDPSPSFLVRHSPMELLLTAEDFDNAVVLKLAHLLETAPRNQTTLPARQLHESPAAAAVRGLIDWLLTYTRGHAYPLLKLAEYCLTQQADLCYLGRYEQIVGGAFFASEAGKAIMHRSYSLSGPCNKSAVNIFTEPWTKAVHSTSLMRAGLWDEQLDWFLSDFLVFCIFAGRTKAREIGVLTIQRIIEIGLGDLSDAHFQQHGGGEELMNRYESSIGSYFGWKIAGIKGLYVSPQHVVPREAGEARRRGQLPTIDYFLNGKHNTFIELVRDSSKLAEHFDKFELDGAAPGQKSKHAGKYYQYRDNYVILDLVLSKAQPTPIPEKHAKAALSKYYSFVAATNTLYLAGRVVKENVSSRLPQHPRARTFCTARRGFEAGGEEGDSSGRAAPPTATAWLLRAGGDATAAAAAASALRAKPPVPVGDVQAAAVSAAKGAGWISTYGSSGAGAGAGAGQRGAAPAPVPGPAHGGWSLRLPLRTNTKAHAGRSVSFLLRISKLV